MRRRRLLAALATGGLAALAGCAGPNGSLRMVAVDDADALAAEYTSPVDGLPPGLRDFLVSVIEDGSGTREGSNPPFDRERPVEYEGAYYRFAYDVVDTRQEPQYLIEIDFDAVDPASVDAIAYEDLPAVDREALSRAFPPPEDPPENDGPDLGVGHVYEDESDSVLVPEPAYDAIVYEGEAYPIRVEFSRDVDVHTYRYTAEQVAADATELAATTRERYRFTLSGLSEAERDIVEAAIDEEYRVEPNESPPEAFESLLSRFREHEAVRIDGYDGEWLTRYAGTDYWADVSFPRDATATGTPGDTPDVTPPPP